MLSVTVQEDAFDPSARLAAFDDACANDTGAVVSFTGRVRDITAGKGGGRDVTALRLDHYPGMTEKQIKKIVDEAASRWDLQHVDVIHRHGTMQPGEPIVFIAVAAKQRAAAFAACEFLIDWVKTKAPFWKCEEGPDGPRWVAARSEDDERAARWREQKDRGA